MFTMPKTRRNLSGGMLPLALATLASGAAGCIHFARPFATSSESTFASGAASTLAEVPTDASGMTLEPIAIGAYVQVVVDSVCYGEMPGRVASSGGNDYFVGSVLTTAASDSDDAESLQRATERELAQGILRASDRSASLPATLVRLAVGSHRCVAQDGLRSIPVALEGSRPRHRPRATFAATYLRALRIHDIDAKIHWAIALGARLLRLVGVDTSTLTDRLRDQQQWIDLVRDLGNLQQAAEVVMLGRFEVPIAPTTEGGVDAALVPAPTQHFVLLLSPDARANDVDALVASGQVRFVSPGVASVDPALGCDRGQSTCPFSSYVTWHVEHATDRSSLAEPAYNDLNNAASAIAGGRFGAALSILTAFTDVTGSGILRGHFSSEDRRVLGEVGQHLTDAARALSPTRGQSSRSACEVLQRMMQAGLVATTATEIANVQVNADLRAGLDGVAGQLRDACASPAAHCDPLQSVYSTDLGQCVPRSGCPNGATRSGASCACPAGTTWSGIEERCKAVAECDADRCTAPVACSAGFTRTAAGACVPADAAEAHALPTDATNLDSAPVFGAATTSATSTSTPPATPSTSRTPSTNPTTATTPNPTVTTSAVSNAGGADVSALRAACEANDPDACNRLGRWYSVGWGGLPHDDASAFGLFDRACDLGSLAACNNYAFMACAGRGTNADLATCLEIYRLDCSIGDGDACSNYATRILSSDPDQAFEYYQKACDVGITEGCRGLATMWYVGCERGGANASLSMCQEVAATERVDIAYSLELDACSMGDGTACREAAAILHDHPDLAGGGEASRRRVVGLLYQGCSLESAVACMDYAQVVQSRDAELARRLRAFSCAQEDAPASCRH